MALLAATRRTFMRFTLGGFPAIVPATVLGQDAPSNKLTVREGRVMADAVKIAGIVWQTGSQQRSDRDSRVECELVRNRRLGRLHAVRVGLPGRRPDCGKTAHLATPKDMPDGFDYDLWFGPAPDAPCSPARVSVNFPWVSDYSGGQVTDSGANHLDTARWGLGMDSSGPVSICEP